MSRGHGVVQRRIIDGLGEFQSEYVAPPLTWFTRDALAMLDVTRQSFSRAAVALHQEGLIDRGLVSSLGPVSTNPHYKNARGRRHPEDSAEWNQGPRLALVVRITATPELLNEWRAIHERLVGLGSGPVSLRNRYRSWVFAFGIHGAFPHSESADLGVQELPVVGSLEATRIIMSRVAAG